MFTFRASEDRAVGAHVQSWGPGGNGKTSTSASGVASVRVTMEDSARGSYARWRSVAGGRGFVPFSGVRLLCRHCQPLATQVSGRVKLEALCAGGQKIRTRLGGSTFVIDPFPEKPKRMRWASYGRPIEKADGAQLERLKRWDYTTES